MVKVQNVKQRGRSPRLGARSSRRSPRATFMSSCSTVRPQTTPIALTSPALSLPAHSFWATTPLNVRDEEMLDLIVAAAQPPASAPPGWPQWGCATAGGMAMTTDRLPSGYSLAQEANAGPLVETRAITTSGLATATNNDQDFPSESDISDVRSKTGLPKRHSFSEGDNVSSCFRDDRALQLQREVEENSGEESMPSQVDGRPRQRAREVQSPILIEPVAELDINVDIDIDASMTSERLEVDSSAEIRLAQLEEELANLRPLLQQRRERCMIVATQLQVVRREERREKDNVWTKQYEMDTKLIRLVTRLQRSFRGFQVRKKLISLKEGEEAKMASWANKLPQQLKQHMKAMQLETYSLRYRDEERLEATIFLQSWWRMILARRIVVLKRSVDWMDVLYDKMSKAAVKLQARFRQRRVRRILLPQVHARIAERKGREYTDMILGHAMVCQVQRLFRAKLGVDRLREKRRQIEDAGVNMDHDDEQAVEPKPVLVDSWSADRQHCQPLSGPVREDGSLDALKNLGCQPFYWSTQSVFPRHCVGGHSALNVAVTLSSSSNVVQKPSKMSVDDARIVGGRKAQLQHPSGSRQLTPSLWHVYPAGLTDALLSRSAVRKATPPSTPRLSPAVADRRLLDDVATVGNCEALAVRKGLAVTSKPGRRGRILPRLKNAPTTPVAAAVPAHSTRRARDRMESREKQAGVNCGKMKEEALSHPLLAGPFSIASDEPQYWERMLPTL